MTELRLYHAAAAPDMLLAKLLVSRLLPDGHEVVVMADSVKEAKRLDDRLWTISDLEFIPHCLVGDRNAGSTPVLISHPEAGEPPVRDVLVSFGVLLRQFASFLHYIVIVPQQLADSDQALIDIARCKERGHRVTVFDLSARG